MSEEKMKAPTTHAKRCLGAIAALGNYHDGKVSHFSRWNIGVVVYGHTQGVQLKTLQSLWRAGLVVPEKADAVGLVADGFCRCGCDRWALTQLGRESIVSMGIKVPERAKRPSRKPFDDNGYDPRDAADWCGRRD
jgi:hypothetical protein